MLPATFLHLRGITEDRERDIWRSGILNWDEFLRTEAWKRHHNDILEAKSKLACSDCDYFSTIIPRREHWRAYKQFRPCFLDIETTGLSKERNRITTIGMYDGTESRVLVRGQDLEEFPELIKQYGMLITFNGSLFDVPFLAHAFPEAKLNLLHTDLRFFLKRLGYSGGLKYIEKAFGIDREELDGVSGADAVRLWHAYERKGDEYALSKLIEYNRADVVNLKILMDDAFERVRSHVFLEQI